LTFCPFLAKLGTMGRPLRAAEGGLIYHCLNRANARLAIFTKEDDFEAFERVLVEAITRHDMRLLASCVMRNHFHLVLWPRADGDLSRFMRWGQKGTCLDLAVLCAV